MSIAPGPDRRTMIVTQWQDGGMTYSNCLLDHQVHGAILGRKRLGARVPYLVRCSYKGTSAPEASFLLKSTVSRSRET